MITTKNKTSYLLELHYKRPLYHKMFEIKNSQDVDTFLRENINLKRIDHKEFFWVIVLTRANRALGLLELSAGTTHSTMVNYKELVQLVSEANASAVVLAHNHPSGKLKPSLSDETITEQSQTILSLIDVTLLDHLIITSEGYYSMVDNKLLINPNY